MLTTSSLGNSAETMRKLQRRAQPLEEGLFAITLGLGVIFAVLTIFHHRLYFAVSEPTYVVLHTIMEIASILVTFAVFIVNWEASKQSRNTQSLFVATGFLTVAVADVMHTLSYSGMPSFITPNSADKAVYFWLFARYWAAGVLLASTIMRPDSSGWYLSRYFLAAVSALAGMAVLAVVTEFGSTLPPMFVAGTGLTPLKVGLEYGVIALNALAALMSIRRYRATGDSTLVVLVAALFVSMFSEAALTIYSSPFDVYNLLGHAYKVVAYYLIFRAFLVTSLERPYIQLKQAKDELESTVEKLNARTRELDALDDVAVTLSSSLKSDELLPLAIDKVMAVMQARAGAIFLVDEDSAQLRLEAWRGLNASTIARYQAHPQAVPHAAVSRLAAGHRPVPEDGELERSLGGSEARIAPLRACVCAPVAVKGKILGTVAMFGGGERTFSSTDANLLTAVGLQLGLAIDNARLYERTDERLREKLLELQQAERKARFLAEASALLASSMELTRVLEMVARKSSEVVGDWCVIYLLDERENTLRMEAVYHSDEDELMALRRLFGRSPTRADEGLLGKVVQSGEAVLVVGEMLQQFSSNLQSMVESIEEIALIHRISPSSAIVAPMRARGRTVGVLVVMETHTSGQLSGAELALVAELGDRAGVAIENSQLFQESQEQRRHLEAVISQMVDGVVIADASGQVLVANRAAQTMLRGQFSRLVEGQSSSERGLWQVPQSDGSPPLISRALAGEALTGEEILVAGEAGQRVLSASFTPVREESGDIEGAVVVLRDVTAEREIDRMKDEFVATVSHELRTPITAVLGYTDLLLRGLRGPLAPTQIDAMTSVRHAGRRLLALIEDLLDISRLEAGKQELLLDVVSVQSAVERAVAAIAFIASSKGVLLVQSVPRELPQVLADDSQLQRILGNLLSNAVKFTPEGGTVTISAAPSMDGGHEGLREWTENQPFRWVILTIKDTGVGIPIDKQDRIWEKFQQVDSSSSRSFGGTGLGLAITKSLVELHGGAVWVESEGVPGKGSTFGFTLPVVPTSD